MNGIHLFYLIHLEKMCEKIICGLKSEMLICLDEKIKPDKSQQGVNRSGTGKKSW
jgi:hypothetical protein